MFQYNTLPQSLSVQTRTDRSAFLIILFTFVRCFSEDQNEATGYRETDISDEKSELSNQSHRRPSSEQHELNRCKSFSLQTKIETIFSTRYLLADRYFHFRRERICTCTLIHEVIRTLTIYRIETRLS